MGKGREEAEGCTESGGEVTVRAEDPLLKMAWRRRKTMRVKPGVEGRGRGVTLHGE